MLLPLVLISSKRITEFFPDKATGSLAYLVLVILAATVGVIGGTIALIAGWNKTTKGVRIAALFGILCGLSLFVMLAVVRSS